MGDWGYLILKIAITIVVILALTALIYWLVRRYSAIALGGIGRGRVPRLAVVDMLTVDRRRRLVLVRRDNVEHLILIGGPSDVVVEATIQRTRSRQASRTPTPPQTQTPEIALVQELAQNGLGGSVQTAPPTETQPAPIAPPQAEMVPSNVERLTLPADRPAPVYRMDKRSAPVDTQQLLEAIGAARKVATPATVEPDPLAPSAAPASPPTAPPHARDFRVVSSEAVPEPQSSAPIDDAPTTKISDLEQEMARLLGQLNVKRP